MTAFRTAGISLTALAGLLLIAGLSTSVSAQNVYKTVDDLGNVEFTDRPPMGADTRPVERVKGLDIEPVDNQKIKAENLQATEQNGKAQAAQKARQVSDAEGAVEQQALNQERVANCKSAKARLTMYQENGRIYRTGDDGEREYLTSDEVDSVRTEAASSVKQWCS
jgi:hypothetical protein